MKLPTYYFLLTLIISSSLAQSSVLQAEPTSITEQWVTFKTYPYSDPNPIPSSGRYYPYFDFDGFTNNAIEKKWKLITIENKYIKVYVMPEIGGKVWGAIEKSTGKEFVYYNDVVKFRDVALRGPWTSGGIEFNFGTLGHSPSTSAPVDYRILKYTDGSASVTVADYDLASRTRWSVDITLEADKAYFQTKTKWFNTTPLWTSLYHWTNAAAKADGNLQFLYLGSHHIGHEGEVSSWPIEDGKNISYYDKNNFGSYKSYHIVNSSSEYFGGYWHDDNFGFGHWSPYDEKLGRKIWIWGLSDQGMIWEDLLTDSSGQYVEWQAGKLFNQALEASSKTPFKHQLFFPNDTDISNEYWFPVMDIGGAVDASPYASMNVTPNDQGITIRISPLQRFNDTLVIMAGKEKVYTEKIDLETLVVSEISVKLNTLKSYTVALKKAGLVFSSDNASKVLKRPLYTGTDFSWNTAYGCFLQAFELEAQRNYAKAEKSYIQCLDLDKDFTPTLSKLAGLNYRMGLYNKALEYTQRVLSHNTYHGEANYLYGLINEALGNNSEAISGFSVAVSDTSLRSAAYLALAKNYLKSKEYLRSQYYVKKSLTFNSNSIGAYELLAVSYRLLEKQELAESTLKMILELDATAPFVLAERYLVKPSPETEAALRSSLNTELPHEVYLELGIGYFNRGLYQAAIQILELSPPSPIVSYWLSYLYEEQGQKNKGDIALNQALNAKPDRVFPFRLETAHMLEHSLTSENHWKTAFYLSLIYKHLGRNQESRQLLKQEKNKPAFPPFYMVRALLDQDAGNSGLKDLLRSYELDKGNWRYSQRVATAYLELGNASKALHFSKISNQKNPENSLTVNTVAKAMIMSKQFKSCLKFLSGKKLLPVEGESEARDLFHHAAISQAILLANKGDYNNAIQFAQQAKEWPVNLGVGKPFDVDNRVSDFIIAMAFEGQNKHKLASEYYQKVAEHDYLKDDVASISIALQVIAAKKLGKGKPVKPLIQYAKSSEDATVSTLVPLVLDGKNKKVKALFQENRKKLEGLQPVIAALIQLSLN